MSKVEWKMDQIFVAFSEYLNFKYSNKCGLFAIKLHVYVEDFEYEFVKNCQVFPFWWAKAILEKRDQSRQDLCTTQL